MSTPEPRLAGRLATVAIVAWRLLAHAVASFWWPKLSIVTDQPGLLVLNANGFTVTASRTEQVVMLNSQPVAFFKGVKAIQLQHFTSGAGNRKREWWIVSLQLSGRKAAYLGKTRDAIEASIAAARLSTLTGKPVVALSQTGLRSSGIES